VRPGPALHSSPVTRDPCGRQGLAERHAVLASSIILQRTESRRYDLRSIDLHIRRGYHEAGHAVVAAHVGFDLLDIHCDPTIPDPSKGPLGANVSRTRYIENADIPHRDRLKVKLAGGVAEDVFLEGRSLECCTDDLAGAQHFLDEMRIPREQRLVLIADLERELCSLLAQDPFSCQVETLAQELAEHHIVTGAWARELLTKRCGSPDGR
jgi:hypothetical protein